MSLKRRFDDTFFSHVADSDMRRERVAEIKKQRHVVSALRGIGLVHERPVNPTSQPSQTLVGARLARDSATPATSKQLTHRHNRHSTHPPVGASLLAIALSAQNTKRAGNIGDLPKNKLLQTLKAETYQLWEKTKICTNAFLCLTHMHNPL
ncbi:hypothetical protein [Pseudomonas ogarae]|uniref:hypothetical protein n=1 Tax=Pseudomonas ogarae (strain DSM 112162 / CECT 30235 / F113) TaxID=1114970 RepID=UPI0015928276|nr:hypothetical protein [Pseudomonas ogarae]